MFGTRRAPSNSEAMILIMVLSLPAALALAQFGKLSTTKVRAVALNFFRSSSAFKV
jgi:hypothetical protein